MAERCAQARYVRAWDANSARLNPDCFAWWWKGTRLFPTSEGGCLAGAHTCTPTEGALSKLKDVGLSRGCFAATGRSMSVRWLTILGTMTGGVRSPDWWNNRQDESGKQVENAMSAR